MAAQGDFVNAVKNFDQELDLCNQFAQRNPANPDCQRRAAQSFGLAGEQQFAQAATTNQAGNGTLALQQATAALASYQKNLAIREELLHSAPDDVDAQHNAAMASEQAGIVLFWIGRNAEGVDAIRTAVRLLENITNAHHGSPQISQDLLWCLYNLSQRSGDAAEAKDALSKSLAIATELEREHEGTDEMAATVKFLEDAKPR